MRPKCKQCGKSLGGQYRYRTAVRSDLLNGQGWQSLTVRDAEPYGYGYGGTGNFCTLRCGFDWADEYFATRTFEQTR